MGLRKYYYELHCGGDGIPDELFQILKDDAMKVLHSICQQIWKISSGHRTGKGQFSFQSQGRAMTRNVHASKDMLKILKARPHWYVNLELSDVQAGFRKSRGTRDQIATSVGSQKKQKNSRKTSTSASLTTLKPSTVWITTNCGKFFKRWEYQTTLPAS